MIFQAIITNNGPLSKSFLPSFEEVFSFEKASSFPLDIACVPCYHVYMIQSFKNSASEDIFNSKNTKETRKVLPQILWKIAKRKMEYLDSVLILEDLASPPGNRLEKLKGSRENQHSIRINDQYRICFIWTPAGPQDVEIVDYHK